MVPTVFLFVVTALVSLAATKQDEQYLQPYVINNATSTTNTASRYRRNLNVEGHSEIEINSLLKETFWNMSTLTIRVTEGIEKVTTYWTLIGNGNGLTGFMVTYRNEKNEYFDSPILDSNSREFVLPQLDKQLTYTICVHAMGNQSELQHACTDLKEQSLKIVVGVMAGVVFLIPCFLALVWLLRKDKKMMKDDQSLLPCAINIEYSIQQTNKQQNNVQEIKVSSSNIVMPHAYVNCVYTNNEEINIQSTNQELTQCNISAVPCQTSDHSNSQPSLQESSQVKLSSVTCHTSDTITSQPFSQNDNLYSNTDINSECPKNESMSSLDVHNNLNSQKVSRL